MLCSTGSILAQPPPLPAHSGQVYGIIDTAWHTLCCGTDNRCGVIHTATSPMPQRPLNPHSGVHATLPSKTKQPKHLKNSETVVALCRDKSCESEGLHRTNIHIVLNLAQPLFRPTKNGIAPTQCAGDWPKGGYCWVSKPDPRIQTAAAVTAGPQGKLQKEQSLTARR